MKRAAFVRCSVLLISVVVFLLALAGAWLRPVWHDELYTLALARLPVGELLPALVVDSGPPLHYLLCHFLFVLVGWQEGSMLGTLMVRLPSVLATGAGCGVRYWSLRGCPFCTSAPRQERMPCSPWSMPSSGFAGQDGSSEAADGPFASQSWPPACHCSTTRVS